jgi:predicted SAM-dependent methyltransferase
MTKSSAGDGGVAENALEGMLRPPETLLLRFGYYRRRYGLLHAVCGYIGRYWSGFWNLVGPIVTRSYLKRWLATANPKILNLGGGIVLFDRWLTADVTPRADVYMDVTKSLPIPDDSVDVVYAEEVIEHVNRESGRQMLSECFRVLKPGGILRLTTPSLDYFAKRALMAPNGFEEINGIFYGHGHRCIYTETALREALRATGFINIARSTYRAPESKYGVFDTHPARVAYALPEWSQYWEAGKPTGKPESQS